MTGYLNLIIHAIATFAMTGIIWFVQMIHYPVLSNLPKKLVSEFEKNHWKQTMHLAVPLLIIELVTAILLLIYTPDGVSKLLPAIGLVLLVAIWISTWSYCVPCHIQLKKQYEKKYLMMLQNANLFRAIIWSFRTIIVSMILYQAIIF